MKTNYNLTIVVTVFLALTTHVFGHPSPKTDTSDVSSIPDGSPPGTPQEPQHPEAFKGKATAAEKKSFLRAQQVQMIEEEMLEQMREEDGFWARQLHNAMSVARDPPKSQVALCQDNAKEICRAALNGEYGEIVCDKTCSLGKCKQYLCKGGLEEDLPSCAGVCGKRITLTQELQYGAYGNGVCFCDSFCTGMGDCCADYETECTP